MTQETKQFSLVPCCFADDDDGGRPIGTSRSRPNGVVVPPIGRASRWPWYADSFHARHSDARHHRPFFLLFFYCSSLDSSFHIVPRCLSLIAFQHFTQLTAEIHLNF